MSVLGIDLSLRSSGICLINDNNETFYLNIIKKQNKIARKLSVLKNIRVSQLPTFENELSMAEVVANEIIDFVKEHKDPQEDLVVVLERPVPNFTGGSTNCTLQLHSQNAIVRYLLEKEFGESICIMFSPTHVKKVFTGRGNGKKDAMLSTFQSLKLIKDSLWQFCQNHTKVESNVNDLIDAYAIIFTYKKERELFYEQK